MAVLKLTLDETTFSKLVRAAAAELRPVPWQAEMILRRALSEQSQPAASEAASSQPGTPRDHAAVPT